MEMDIFMMYVEGMRQLKNEDMITSMTVSDYPKLKQDARKTMHRKIFKSAFPNEFNNPKNIVKLSDLKKVLG